MAQQSVAFYQIEYDNYLQFENYKPTTMLESIAPLKAVKT
jgi:hypothetical protein